MPRECPKRIADSSSQWFRITRSRFCRATASLRRSRRTPSLQWDENIASCNEGVRLERLKEAVARQNRERVILNRCNDESAIRFGHSLGVYLFQGFGVDRLLSGVEAA